MTKSLSCKAFLCLLLLSFLPGALAEPAEGHPFFQQPLLLGAHRGGALLWPENTVIAFEKAAKRWPHILLEADLRLTSDRRVVVLHDATVDRTTDATGPVADYTFAKLRELDAAYHFSPDEDGSHPYRGRGIRVPTLEEVLEAAPEHRFLLEIKGGPEDVEPVVDVLRARGEAQRILLASFNPATMARLRSLAPELLTCYDMQQGTALLLSLRGESWQTYIPQAQVLSLTQKLLAEARLTAEEVARIQEKGILVQLHTPNTVEELQRALALGVESILTDHPERLAELIPRREEMTAASEVESEFP